MPPRKKAKLTTSEASNLDQPSTNTSNTSAMNDGWVGFSEKLYKRYDKAIASERQTHSTESSSQHTESSQSSNRDQRSTRQQEQTLSSIPQLKDLMKTFDDISEPEVKEEYSQQERNHQRLACLENMHDLLTQQIENEHTTFSSDQEKIHSYKKMHEVVEKVTRSIYEKHHEVLLDYINQPQETSLTPIAWSVLTQDHLRSMQEPMDDEQPPLQKAISLLKANQPHDIPPLSMTEYLNLNLNLTEEIIPLQHKAMLQQFETLQSLLTKNQMPEATRQLESISKEIGHLVLKTDWSNDKESKSIEIQIAAWECTLEGKHPAERAILKKGYQIDIDQEHSDQSGWPQTIEIKPIRANPDPLTTQDILAYTYHRVDAELRRRAIEKLNKERKALPTVLTLLNTLKDQGLQHQLEILENQSQDIKDSCAYQIIKDRLHAVNQNPDKVKSLLIGQILNEQIEALSKLSKLIDHISYQNLQEQISTLSKQSDSLLTSSTAPEDILKRLTEIQRSLEDYQTKQSQAQKVIKQWKDDIPELIQQLERISDIRAGGAPRQKADLEKAAEESEEPLKTIYTNTREKIWKAFSMSPNSLAKNLTEKQIKVNKRKLPLLRALTYFSKTGEKPKNFPWGMERWWPQLENKQIQIATYTPTDETQSILYATTEPNSLSQAFGYNKTQQDKLKHIFDPKTSNRSTTIEDKNGNAIGIWQQAFTDTKGNLPIEINNPFRIYIGYMPRGNNSEIVAWEDHRTNRIDIADQLGDLSQKIEPQKDKRWLKSIQEGSLLRSHIWPLLHGR